MLIYISHPYNGKKANKRDVERTITGLIQKYPEHIFISPIHTFGNWYKKVGYHTGMKWCLQLLARCDAMWVYGDILESKGCVAEIQYCIDNGIDYWIKAG